jgi:hypothetical protein
LGGSEAVLDVAWIDSGEIDSGGGTQGV